MKNENYITDMAFVILHYNAIQETLNLISSIKQNIDTNNYMVIVVDNCSPNNSGKVLDSTFQNDGKVTVILNKENLGFACGNNVGIRYARHTFNPKFICCLNNDTLMIQPDFMKRIRIEYDNSHAAVIGPLAYLRDGTVQISAFKLKSIDFYRHELAIEESNKKNNINSYKYWIKNRCPLIYNFLSKCKNYYIYYPRLYRRREDCILHGSCLIFTPVFFKELDGFDNRTFLYREEELLYITLKKHNLKSVYNPKIKIRHLEDCATNTMFATTEERRMFTRKNQIQSLTILIQEFKNID